MRQYLWSFIVVLCTRVLPFVEKFPNSKYCRNPEDNDKSECKADAKAEYIGTNIGNAINRNKTSYYGEAFCDRCKNKF